MMGNVVGGVSGVDGGRTPRASRRVVGILCLKVETTHERSPAHASIGQQVSDILAAHLYLVARWGGADVADWVGIADNRQCSVTAVDFIASSVEGVGYAVGLARDEVQQTDSGRPEGRAVGIVTHREMLS